MTVIGLTGNFASGKSHVAEVFKSFGALVQDSDKVVHELIAGEAKAAIEQEFGTSDRKELGAIVFGNEDKLKKLEAILHPLVRKQNVEFAADNQDRIVVLEIPLLFETEAEKICDYTVLVNVSRETQKSRALARSGMNEEKFAAIMKEQTKIPVEEKRKRADFVVENDAEHDTITQIKAILGKINNA